MNYNKRFEELLSENGMTLLRTAGRHAVYTNSNGRIFVTSKTPSDRNAARQRIRSLERFLGLRPQADVPRCGGQPKRREE